MNESQKLAVMQLRAKIKVQELLEKHDMAWNGEEAEVVEEEVEE